MSYEEFKKAVEKMVNEGFFGEGEVSFQKVLKTNEELDSMSVRMNKDINIAPNIYLNGLYQRYCNGESIEDLLVSVKEFVSEIQPKADLDIDALFEDVEKRIVFSLINAEKNRELLKEVPHRMFLDFAIVYRIMVELPYEQQGGSIIIKNAMLEIIGFSEEDLYQFSLNNCLALRGVTFNTMEHTIESICCGNADDGGVLVRCTEDISRITWDFAHSSMEKFYILSSVSRVDGAAVILLPEVMKKVADAIGTDFYIIPSSVHEVLIIASGQGENIEQMKDMISNVNANELSPDEFLSNNLYHYSYQTGEIKIA